MIFRVIQAEWFKVRKSTVWLPILLAPLLAVGLGFLSAHRGSLGQQPGQNAWSTYYFTVVSVYALLLLPLLTGVLASLICRSEHLAGGWKQVLAVPISRSTIYLTKFLYVLVMIALAQVLLLGGVLLTGLLVLHGMLSDPVPWSILFRSLLGGWLATIPLAALQLWVSSVWKSFGAPFALNVVLTVPAVAVAHSVHYGPIYPWAQPMLAMLPTDHGFLYVTPETITTIALSGLVLILAGWIHFVKRDVTS